MSVVFDSMRPHRWQPTRLHRPWDSPGKNTGVGCHCLLQCMKVKSESEVAQSCLTPCDPTDCSLPGSSVHGIFQARVLEWVAIAFSKEGLVKGREGACVAFSFLQKDPDIGSETPCCRKRSTVITIQLIINFCLQEEPRLIFNGL